MTMMKARHKYNHERLASLLLLPVLTLVMQGCTTVGDNSLRSLDINRGSVSHNEVFVKPKTEEEVKEAYDNYIKNASSGDHSRLSAINRLAELEIGKINALVKDSRDIDSEDILYRQSLQRTLDLLNTSLEEFPDAATNDNTLYQLARVYEQLGEPDKSLAALRELSQKYPKSKRYAEAQFRLAETAFVEGDYITAEDAYSEALFADTNDAFYERSLFKRGWSRYKQGLYIRAADDYLAAVKSHQFDDYSELEGSERDEFDEYFRAIGLAFANLQDVDTLQSFFSGDSGIKYLYHTYRTISDIYLDQERFSDAAGVLLQFVEANPDSPKIPLAKLKIVDTWRAGEFETLFHESLESLYSQFHPNHDYWNGSPRPEGRKDVFEALRDYAREMAFYHQTRYQRSRDKAEFALSKRWYTRYLEHYSAYSRQDRIYSGYAELLAAEGQDEAAMPYFELAAYDGEIILDKASAYSTIVLSDKLHQQSNPNPKWLDKHIRYSLMSASLYPMESRYHKVALHAAELAFDNGRYDEAVALTNTLPDEAAESALYEAGALRGLAYLKASELEEAERAFVEVLSRELDDGQREEQYDNLALSIYEQAERDREAQESESAVHHFSRIARLAPNSDIAPLALYEAVVLSMDIEQWNNAISYAEHLQKSYPTHALNKDATRQLSAAYLEAGDSAKAAQAFEQLSLQDEDRKVKMAALWQAAELYESKDDLESAIRSYRSYAHSYPEPYPQQIEAMYKLTQLYSALNDFEKRQFWRDKIAERDQKASQSQKTDRTNHIAASVLLDLARDKALAFREKILVAPLTRNLREKKQLMQESINFYGRASSYRSSSVTTEATYSIGRIYEEFAEALLESERPPDLEGEELDQYNILIEDQAFPFEDKAIEFYEINLARVKDGLSNQWITQSYQKLVPLFPARYDRNGKLDAYHDGL